MTLLIAFWPVIISIGMAPSMGIGGRGGEIQRARAQASTRQTPGRPVSRPWVAAMKAAACSCRVSTSSIVEWRSDSTHVEILFTGDAEDAIDALVLQCRDQEVGAFGHGSLLFVVQGATAGHA